MEGDRVAPGPEPDDGRPSRSSTTRAAANAADVALGYGLAAARAGVSAAVGIGRGAAEMAGQLIDRSPVGTLAAGAADALEPAAERARRQRKDTADEAMAVVETVVERVVGEVVGLLDVDGIVRQVDVEDIIDRVDVDEIVKRVDVNDVVSRVDVDEIVGRVDIDEIITRTEMGSVIMQSTTSVASGALDTARAQTVGLDNVVTSVTDRVLRRRRGPRPDSPPLLEEPEAPAELPAAGEEP
ncbi:MAG: hypothetical protein AAGK32_07250 [Actinomycetota bacterium]